MKNFFKRSLAAVSTALVLTCSIAASTDFSIFDNAQSITASAYECIATGAFGTKLSAQCGTDGKEAWMYFTIISESEKTAYLSGSSIADNDVSVYLPSTVNLLGKTYTITGIYDNALKNQTKIKSLSGASEVKYIGKSAFYGCTALQYCDIGNKGRSGFSVETVDDYAFYGCKNFTGSGFMNYLKSIGNYAFNECFGLTSITFDKLESLGEYAFYKCFFAEHLSFGNSPIKKIPNSAFRYCNYLYDIHFSDNIVEIGDNAFEGASVDVLYLPKSLNAIGKKAFFECYSLETVCMPEHVRTIGDSAFNSTSMKHFYNPNRNTVYGTRCLGYTNRKATPDFVMWNKDTSTSEYNYAKECGFEFKLIKNAAGEKIESFKPYMWQIGNTDSSFADSNGHYLIDPVHMKLETAAQTAAQEWGGTCYGMAAVSALSYNGDIKVTDFTSGSVDTIRKITYTKLTSKIKSFINLIWGAGNDTYSHDCSVYSSNLLTISGSDFMRYAQEITYGADVPVFSYHWEIGPGHAINCLGIEFKENAADNRSSIWNTVPSVKANARILLYDVNYREYSANRCLYFNTETGDWFMYNTLGELMTKNNTPMFSSTLNFRAKNMVLNSNSSLSFLWDAVDAVK